MSNNDNKSCASTSINYEKLICRNISKTIENTHFFMLRFLHFFIKIRERGKNEIYRKNKQIN